MSARPFQIDITEAVLRDLHDRLEALRWPESLGDDDWADGTSLSFMRRLVDYRLHRFDRRAQENRLNRLPNYVFTVEGQRVHFAHQRGTGPAPNRL